jgi:hypothetical protein
LDIWKKSFMEKLNSDLFKDLGYDWNREKIVIDKMTSMIFSCFQAVLITWQHYLEWSMILSSNPIFSWTNEVRYA